MSRDSVGHTLLVATMLCVACSLLVSGASVVLRPRQMINKERDRQRTILALTGLYNEDAPIEKAIEKIETRLVDLETGKFVDEDQLDPDTFDQRQAARDPATSVEIDPKDDLAGIGRRAKYSLVYLVREGGRVEQIVLPVHGTGLWSTMYGFISLATDGTTIRGITFYEHGETPGLGGEIDNPAWQASWEGKRVFDDDGTLRIEVIKGPVDTQRADAPYQVDGISGATITANGVTEMLHYWLGDNGFGPFLEQLEAKGVIR